MNAYERVMTKNSNDTDDGMHSAAYIGYIAGFHDTFAFLAKEYARDPEAAKGLLSRFPESTLGMPNLQATQVFAMVTKFIKNNPHLWNFSAPSILFMTFIPGN